MGFVLKKRFTGVAAAVCLLILTLLPAGAFAESVTFDYGMDKSYNNGRLLWDGDKLLLDVYPGEMPDEIIFDLTGHAAVTVTIRLMGDVQFPEMKVQNQSSSYYNYSADLRFASGDGQPHQVQVRKLFGTGADDDHLIVDSGIDMTVNYASLGGSAGVNSYLDLAEDAKLTFEPMQEDSGYWTSFNFDFVQIGENALLVNHSVLYDDGLPTSITFASTSPSAAGRFVIEVNGAAVISNKDSSADLPQWLQDLIKQNGWQFGPHESLQSNAKTILDQNGNIVTSFILYNHAHVAGSTPTGVKVPTCTEDGYTGDLVCVECGSVIQAGSTIPKLDHSYQNAVCVNCGAPDPGAPVPPPSTGDTTPLALWLSLLALTGACLVFAGIRAKRSPR